MLRISGQWMGQDGCKSNIGFRWVDGERGRVVKAVRKGGLVASSVLLDGMVIAKGR